MKELYYVARVDKGNLVPPSKIRITRQSLMKIWLYQETFFGHPEYQFLCWLIKMSCRDAGAGNTEVPVGLPDSILFFICGGLVANSES